MKREEQEDKESVCETDEWVREESKEGEERRLEEEEKEKEGVCADEWTCREGGTERKRGITKNFGFIYKRCGQAR